MENRPDRARVCVCPFFQTTQWLCAVSAGLLLLLCSLTASNAAPLVAGGDHALEIHASDDHSGEQLQFIILSSADLTSSDLRRTYLADSSLDWATLVEAKLEKADFTRADLSFATMTKAKAKHATFRGAILDAANLSEGDMKQADFTGASMVRTTLMKTKIEKADFTGANLTGATVTDSKSKGAVFAGAILDASSFQGSDVKDADFAGASLLRADFSNLKNARKAEFAGAYYDEATLLDPDIDTSEMIFLPEPGQTQMLGASLVLLSWMARRRRERPGSLPPPG